eukprot:1255446-Pyramimonas_sp.AAC.1
MAEARAPARAHWSDKPLICQRVDLRGGAVDHAVSAVEGLDASWRQPITERPRRDQTPEDPKLRRVVRSQVLKLV